MGASLRYAKVVDRDRLQRGGGRVRPGLDSQVRLEGPAPGRALPFSILRAWKDEDGSFTETWRILDPHGRTLREGMAREVLPSHGDLVDDVEDAHFEYADDGYQLVLEIDGREVARADFPVVEGEDRQ